MDKNLSIRLATNEDSQLIKDFDDMCFGAFHGVELEEIKNVIKHGAVFLLYKENELVGESQIVLTPFEGCKAFPADCAYCYGTAIHPAHQGQGYGHLLVREQELFAKENGKDRLYFSVRVENYPSLKMRLDSQSEIIGYDPYFYGPNPEEDSRLILTKKIGSSKVTYPITQFIPVSFTSYNKETHEKIASLFASGYVGFEITKQGIVFGLPE